jgi:hypothetical protein
LNPFNPWLISSPIRQKSRATRGPADIEVYGLAWVGQSISGLAFRCWSRKFCRTGSEYIRTCPVCRKVPEKFQNTIEGRITQFLLRNPHSFLHVTVVDKDGKEQNWNVEWAAAGQLGGAGVTRESLKVGDPVVITSNPARDLADQRLRMVTVKRTSDRFNWGFRQGQVVE